MLLNTQAKDEHENVHQIDSTVIQKPIICRLKEGWVMLVRIYGLQTILCKKLYILCNRPFVENVNAAMLVLGTSRNYRNGLPTGFLCKWCPDVLPLMWFIFLYKYISEKLYAIISDQALLFWLCKEFLDVGLKKVPVNHSYFTVLLNSWIWIAQRYLLIFYNSITQTIVPAVKSHSLLFSYSS